MGDILKEAIADAKAVRETALENAKMALEEAFTPQIKSMLSAKLKEEEDDDKEEGMHDEGEHEDEAEEGEHEEGMREDDDEAEEGRHEEGEHEEGEHAEEGEHEEGMHDEDDDMEENLDLEAVIKELSENPFLSFAQNKNPSESAKVKVELYISCISFLYLSK